MTLDLFKEKFWLAIAVGIVSVKNEAQVMRMNGIIQGKNWSQGRKEF